MAGPLAGYRVVELAGLGPGPFCAMVLSDLGAEVLRVDRVGDVHGRPPGWRPADEGLRRGRRSVAVDMKAPGGTDTVLRLLDAADALVEGFRPGVAERLGIGPDVCLERNPRLVYGRMTGWGQDGPLAQVAGHDINYIALAGALHPIGRAGEAPVPPLNLVGDFGGGGLLLALGITAALLERERSGQGQVVDAAMVDGAALLMALIYGMHGLGEWRDERGANLLDTGAPYYDVYETADAKHLAVGPVEEPFFMELMRVTGLEFKQGDRDAWPALRTQLSEVFRTRTRDEWCAAFADAGADACIAPVLSLAEAPQHPHNVARGTFVEVDGLTVPGPAPRFSRTPAAVQGPPPMPGRHTDEALVDWGFTAGELAALRDAGAVA